MCDDQKILVLYDIRGIQNYIFRTTKMNDAIGASQIVEGLFESVIGEAVKAAGLCGQLEWYDENGILPYDDSQDMDVKVLYIGGGNASCIFRNIEMAREVNRLMARRVMEKTYSLQLAAAMVPKSDNYSRDYAALMEEMARVKDGMAFSKPLDALPVVDVEIKTGFPVVSDSSSRESILKKEAGIKARMDLGRDEKILDNYISGKGESSMLAVVHIDGNNMGLRIRQMISGKQAYNDAVNEMRRISYVINTSYKKAYTDMVSSFQEIMQKGIAGKKKETAKWWIMKVIDAGDDITYVCNAGIALATVECFLEKISGYSMKPEDEDSRYRFSACAGISYFNSHFPFNIAYSVAEECCDSAKQRAKEEENQSDGMIGNWLDFQFCRNVFARNLEKIRAEEYETANGEKLLRRPYYVYSAALSDGQGRFESMRGEPCSYEAFQADMRKYVLDSSNIPRSFTKEMRNTYPLGENQMQILKAFLKSRENPAQGRVYPDDFYYTDADGERTAILYDALEVADYYHSYEDLKKKAEQGREQ